MVEITNAKIAKFFEDGKITYAEAVALVVQARAYVANDNAAFETFRTAYAASTQRAWAPDPRSLAATGDGAAIRLLVAQLLESVGFDRTTAKPQGDAIGDLWTEYVSASTDAQARAWHDTHELTVRLRTNGAQVPAGRSVASPATVDLAGAIEGQQIIRSAFDDGITGEKARVLVVRARLFVKKPMATDAAEIRDALAKYLSGHGFPMANAIELGQLIEAAWRAHNETGAPTFVDVSAVKLSALRGGAAVGDGTRWVAKPATVSLKGSEQGQRLLGGMFRGGKLTAPEARTLVMSARSFAKLPDNTSDSAKIRPALQAYLEAHGFGTEPAIDLAQGVDAAWHAANEKGQAVEVDVSGITFTATGGVTSVADLKARYGALDERLTRLKERVRGVTSTSPVEAALAKSAALQSGLGAGSGSLGADALTLQVEATDAARTLLERVERVLAGLETYRGYLTTAPEPYRGLYLQAVDAVTTEYVKAVAQAFDASASVIALTAAEDKAAELPFGLMEVDLTQFEARKPGDKALKESRQAIGQWVALTRGELTTLKGFVEGRKPASQIEDQGEVCPALPSGNGSVGDDAASVRGNDGRPQGVRRPAYPLQGDAEGGCLEEHCGPAPTRPAERQGQQARGPLPGTAVDRVSSAGGDVLFGDLRVGRRRPSGEAAAGAGQAGRRPRNGRRRGPRLLRSHKRRFRVRTLRTGDWRRVPSPGHYGSRWGHPSSASRVETRSSMWTGQAGMSTSSLKGTSDDDGHRGRRRSRYGHAHQVRRRYLLLQRPRYLALRRRSVSRPTHELQGQAHGGCVAHPGNAPCGLRGPAPAGLRRCPLPAALEGRLRTWTARDRRCAALPRVSSLGQSGRLPDQASGCSTGSRRSRKPKRSRSCSPRPKTLPTASLRSGTTTKTRCTHFA